MQYLHPMQRPWSMHTMPSSLVYVAPVGQTVWHGASSQCMHCEGITCKEAVGYVPDSASENFTNGMLAGTSFWFWHAKRQAPQPMHLVVSITIPYRAIAYAPTFLISTGVSHTMPAPVAASRARGTMSHTLAPNPAACVISFEPMP